MAFIDRTAHVTRNSTGRSRVKGYRMNAIGVDAVVLHQMGFNRGSATESFDTVTAHFAVLRNGDVLLLHPIDEYLHASNGLNARGIAIEFEGAFPSERGRWHRDVPTIQQILPTLAQITAARKLITGLRNRGTIAHIFAHRQSNGDQKSNCPGPHVWYNVGQYFVNSGLLSDGGRGFTFSRGSRTGMPIPDAWRDPSLKI